MADRACRNFKPNVFNNSKCQNCFKLREAHSTSIAGPDASFQSIAGKQSTQKVGNFSIAIVYRQSGLIVALGKRPIIFSAWILSLITIH